MNYDQYIEMNSVGRQGKHASIVDIVKDKSRNRTLAIGINSEYHYHHLYIEDGNVHLIVYAHNTRLGRYENKQHLTNDEITFGNAIPDRRLYPERCDYQFCADLASYGVQMSFATYDEVAGELAERQTFSGPTMNERTLEFS